MESKDMESRYMESKYAESKDMESEPDTLCVWLQRKLFNNIIKN